MKINPLLLTDFYKTGHQAQYPEGTEIIYSNFTPRGSRIEGINEVVVFGIQYFIKKYLIEGFNTNFFNRPKEEVVAEYKRVLDNSLGKDSVAMAHIEALHDLGYLPLEIRALPEGTVSPMKTPVLTVHNTKPEFFWLTNFIETLLSNVLWGAMNSATIAYQYRKTLKEFEDKTSDMEGFTDWQGHDFSMRGMFGLEAAMISGAGHLLSFTGSDTIPAITFLETYYNANSDNELIAGSVPATEHSVQCAGGEESEIETYRRLLQTYPSGIISIVSDTWDYFNVLTNILPTLKDEIMERDGKTVVRPDCYDDKTEILTELGWVLFSELQEGLKVAQFRDSGIDYVLPESYISQDYSGEMVHFYDLKGRLDLVVTPNHRMVITKPSGDLELIEAKDVKTCYKRDMLRCGISSIVSEDLTPFERFLIAFQADGSFPSSHKKTKINVCGYTTARFNFQKERKTERLSKICASANLEYTIHKEPKRGVLLNQVTFYVKVPNTLKLHKYFKDWVVPAKKSKKWCTDFIEELSHWDATIRSKTRIKYDTCIESNAHIVQHISILCGKGCTYGVYVDKRKEHFSDVHSLTIIDKPRLGGQSIRKEVINYSGKVYCVKVPSGMLVIRRNRKVLICGNSGNPVLIIAGDLSAPAESPEQKGSIELLWETFGGTINSKGYKQLDSHIGLIYGDSITMDKAKEICERLERKGFASTNVVLGIGSYSYQYNTRDTFNFAMKSTYASINGKDIPIFKKPKTDSGTKNSHKGLLRVNEDFSVSEEVSWPETEGGLLEPVFVDGKLIKDFTLAEIRERLKGN